MIYCCLLAFKVMAEAICLTNRP